TIGELGIVRDARDDAGRAVVTITPTYSGCPAMHSIRADIATALTRAGYSDVDIETVYAPAWTTDWVTESGRAKLARAGIAPPPGDRPAGAGPFGRTVLPLLVEPGP